MPAHTAALPIGDRLHEARLVWRLVSNSVFMLSGKTKTALSAFMGAPKSIKLWKSLEVVRKKILTGGPLGTQDSLGSLGISLGK